MAKTFQFGLALRTQYPMEADITQKFEDLLQVVRLADELGYDSLTKTSHYSTALPGLPTIPDSRSSFRRSAEPSFECRNYPAFAS